VAKKNASLGQFLLFGIVVVALYSGLYVYEKDIIEWSTRGGWFFLVPLTIAFVFSFFHGKFTSDFWDFLGIKAK
jgi:hypothetical protein